MYGLQDRNVGFKEEKSIYLPVWRKLQSIQQAGFEGLVIEAEQNLVFIMNERTVSFDS
jgi:hypothetical protein